MTNTFQTTANRVLERYLREADDAQLMRVVRGVAAVERAVAASRGPSATNIYVLVKGLA